MTSHYAGTVYKWESEKRICVGGGDWQPRRLETPKEGNREVKGVSPVGSRAELKAEKGPSPQLFAFLHKVNTSLPLNFIVDEAPLRPGHFCQSSIQFGPEMAKLLYRKTICNLHTSDSDKFDIFAAYT